MDELDDYFPEEELPDEVIVEQDFTLKIAESLPGPLSAWLKAGDKSARTKKVALLALALLLVLLLIFCVIIGITFFVNGGESTSTSSSDDDTPNPTADDGDTLTGDYMLPDWAYPSAYRIRLTPDLETYDLTGVVTITFQLTEPDHNSLILNSKDIQINDVTVNSHDISYTDVEYNEDYEMLTLSFSESLPEGEDIEIEIHYSGEIQEEMAGFYRSSYIDDEGNRHALASTQFEPTAARLAFPCFDEPSMKATFVITLDYEDVGSTVALSNMPEESREVVNGRTIVEFQETPIMSSYLVAFIIGDFESVDGEYNGMPVKVWSPVGMAEQGLVALNVTVMALDFFEEFFGQPYTLPKLDLIAIPDFEAGAMENWGLITFRMTALLYNAAEDTAANLQRVSTVVTHELAHQWTGDLVTMAWWSDLWLNEGFADFFETESVASIIPEWMMRDQFLVEDQQRAFSLDSLMSTRPVVHNPTITSSDISEMFDTITYSKGGSILRMLQDVLGEEMFKEGIQEYIASFQFGNVLTPDFLDSMSETSATPVAEHFEKWLYEPGYPVVTVTLQGDRLEFTQERFISTVLGNGDTASPIIPTPWWINIKYQSDNGYDEVSFDSDSVSITLPGSTSYVKANVGQNGYYRVNYPVSVWLELKRNIASFSNPADRAGLVNDALVLARAGRLSTPTALEFTSILSDDVEYTVWVSGLSEISYIGTMLTTEADFGLFEQFVHGLLSEVVEYVGWDTLRGEPSSHNQALLRASVLNFAVRFEMPSVVATALDLWDDFVMNGAQIAPDDRQAVYCAALHYGGANDYQFLLTHLGETDNAAEQKRVLYSLGCTREFYLLQHTLDISLDSDVVRPQDQRTVIAGVAANPLGRDLAWNFVQANFEVFNTLGFSLSSLITTVTSHFNDQFHLREVETFFDMQDTVGASMAVEQSKEAIEANIQWMERNAPAVSEWLQQQNF